MDDYPKENMLIDNFVVTRHPYVAAGDDNSAAILLPGMTEHRSSLDILATRLQSKGVQAFSIDLPGQGDSGRIFSLENIAEALDTVQDALRGEYGVSRIGVFANSVSAIAAAMAASHNPKAYDALVLSAPPECFEDAFYIKPLLYSLKNFPEPVNRGIARIADAYFYLQSKEYRQLSHPQFRVNMALGRISIGALRIDASREFSSMIHNSPRLSHFAPDVKIPTMLIYGNYNALLGMSGGALPKEILDAYESFQNGITVLIQGADHGLNGRTVADKKFNSDPEFYLAGERIAAYLHGNISNSA